MQTSWDLSLILKDTSEKSIKLLRNKVERESNKFISKWKHRNDYLENPKVLKEALDEYNYWVENYGANAAEEHYFGLQSSLNQNDPEVKARVVKAKEVGKKIWNEIQFFENNIAKVNLKVQKKFLSHKPLKEYKHFLERLFVFGDHILSDSEEKIINLKQEPAQSNWTRMLQGFLTREEKEVTVVKVKKEIHNQKEIKVKSTKTKTHNFSEILSLINNKEKEVRDSAARALNEILSKHLDVAENEVNSVFQNKKINDELKHYQRPDAERHLNDDIDTEVVDSLVKSVSSRFDIPRKYYKLKSQLLGVTQLQYHERSVSYGGISKEYLYEDSTKLLSKVFSELDEEFGKIFNSFVHEGRIDVFPKKGKYNGAFCDSRLKSQPIYLLLNWDNRLGDVLTFAHEMGHGINYELVKKSQNAINFGTTVATTEVASTFMEDFALEELKKTADDEDRLSIMMRKLNDDVSTIFRQVACYKFEWDLHAEIRERGYLDGVEIGKLFQKHMKAYMGPAVEQSEGSPNWWVFWNHVRYFFYVYSYASGLLISKSLQASVKNNPKFIVKVKEFLSAGLSDSPNNIFARLGIDITNNKFWDMGIGEVENLLNETQKLAKKLGKI